MKKMYLVSSHFDWDGMGHEYPYDTNYFVTEDLELAIARANIIFQKEYEEKEFISSITSWTKQQMKLSNPDFSYSQNLNEFSIFTMDDQGRFWEVSVSEIPFEEVLDNP